MSKEEAVTFLQEIKYHLDKLKNHYIQRGSTNLQKNKENEILQLQQSQKQSLSLSDFPTSNQAYNEKPKLHSNFDMKQLRLQANKKRSADIQTPLLALEKPLENEKLAEDEYNELLERLTLADLLYTEYSLEEVVYHLAKVMFTQSLTRGSNEAQQALQKFTDFLEIETAQGRISRTLERKVLDILVAAISDTLKEHPESASGNQNFIGQKMVDPNADERMSIRDFLITKEQDKINRPQHLNKEKLNNHFRFNFLKYKAT
ncbi:unnamed protein product [Acanthoscelides obtectus]|uniref:Uncharacterized protein n=1 Tax=Acanthoscelides obtectus TaxID=200917 RepID=A0A9P0PUI5_ACAOB|nr:unnamed protein product [Acanthoscelides obtectus]CAK1655757.1 hypothetical protein AOBTE_LOCUS19307 [Acanthoscelides obtectus]